MNQMIMHGDKVVPLEEFYAKPTVSAVHYVDDALTVEKIEAAVKILERNPTQRHFQSGQWMEQEYCNFMKPTPLGVLEEGGDNMNLYKVSMVNIVEETFLVVHVIAKDEDTARIKGFNSTGMDKDTIDDVIIEVENIISWEKK